MFSILATEVYLQAYWMWVTSYLEQGLLNADISNMNGE